MLTNILRVSPFIVKRLPLALPIRWASASVEVIFVKKGSISGRLCFDPMKGSFVVSGGRGRLFLKIVNLALKVAKLLYFDPLKVSFPFLFFLLP